MQHMNCSARCPTHFRLVIGTIFSLFLTSHKSGALHSLVQSKMCPTNWSDVRNQCPVENGRNGQSQNTIDSHSTRRKIWQNDTVRDVIGSCSLTSAPFVCFLISTSDASKERLCGPISYICSILAVVQFRDVYLSR